MISLCASEFLYHGIERWDFGLDNPNKAAILLASLLLPLLAAILRVRRSWLAWGCALLAAAVGYELIHTFSRGGFVALAAGCVILLVAAGRNCKSKRRLIPLMMVAGVLAVSMMWTGFADRLANSAPMADGSTGNRLIIWKAVPGMMANAPGGWGAENAGDAFMGWYQPLSRHERYRTLVNSHFTWLVEWGWKGRWAYVAGWLFALWLGAIRMRKRNDPLPLALFVCLGTGAFFSSVAEEWYVWIAPAAVAVPMVKSFLSESPTGRMATVALAVTGGGVLTALLTACGHIRPVNSIPIHQTADGQRIFVGRDEPTDWIVFDHRTMGGKTYGRALRAFLNTDDGKGRSIGIAIRLSAVPTDARRLVLCGDSANGGMASLLSFTRLEEVRVLSPTDPLKWLASCNTNPPIQVICGDLSPNCPTTDVPGLKTVPGAGDFLPAWPQLAFSGRTFSF